MGVRPSAATTRTTSAPAANTACSCQRPTRSLLSCTSVHCRVSPQGQAFPPKQTAEQRTIEAHASNHTAATPVESTATQARLKTPQRLQQHTRVSCGSIHPLLVPNKKTAQSFGEDSWERMGAPHTTPPCLDPAACGSFPQVRTVGEHPSINTRYMLK